jgi:hypothetical protein
VNVYLFIDRGQAAISARKFESTAPRGNYPLLWSDPSIVLEAQDSSGAGSDRSIRETNRNQVGNANNGTANEAVSATI